MTSETNTASWSVTVGDQVDALTTPSDGRIYNIPGSLNMPFQNKVVASQSPTLAMAARQQHGSTWQLEELVVSDSP